MEDPFFNDPEILAWNMANPWINDPADPRSSLAKTAYSHCVQEGKTENASAALEYVEQVLSRAAPKKTTNKMRNIPTMTDTNAKRVSSTPAKKRDLTMKDATNEEIQFFQKNRGLFKTEASFLKALTDSRRES